MSLPGFTAETALYQTSGNYRMVRTFASVEGAIQVAQDNCFKDCMDDCVFGPTPHGRLECLGICRCECLGVGCPHPTPTCINQYDGCFSGPNGNLRICDPGSSNTGLSCGAPINLPILGMKEICVC